MEALENYMFDVTSTTTTGKRYVQTYVPGAPVAQRVVSNPGILGMESGVFREYSMQCPNLKTLTRDGDGRTLNAKAMKASAAEGTPPVLPFLLHGPGWCAHTYAERCRLALRIYGITSVTYIHHAHER